MKTIHDQFDIEVHAKSMPFGQVFFTEKIISGGLAGKIKVK